jgi:hypothetical protein
MHDFLPCFCAHEDFVCAHHFFWGLRRIHGLINWLIDWLIEWLNEWLILRGLTLRVRDPLNTLVMTLDPSIRVLVYTLVHTGACGCGKWGGGAGAGTGSRLYPVALAQLGAPHVEYAAENSKAVKEAPMGMPAKNVVAGRVQLAVLDDFEIANILEQNRQPKMNLIFF